jgi:dephospho-CoA kinase
LTVIGLAGKAGSGKSTIAERLEKLGIERISLDEIGHSSLIEAKQEIVCSFGKRILTCDEVDRKKLSRIVFRDGSLLDRLNQIVHPIIKKKALEIVERSDSDLLLIDGALIHEIGLSSYCDKIIWFECADEEAVKRLVNRGISESQAKSILSSQSYLDRNKELANVVVSTSGSIEETFRTTMEVLFEWGIVV